MNITISKIYHVATQNKIEPKSKNWKIGPAKIEKNYGYSQWTSPNQELSRSFITQKFLKQSDKMISLLTTNTSTSMKTYIII